MKSALRYCAAEALVSSAPAAPPPKPAEHLLSGHSGALVVLHSNGTDSFVRKTAASPAASPRLKAQADKQHALWMHGLPFPKVRAQRVDADGIASFDMNYIPGRTIADAVANGGAFDAPTVAKAVERLIWIFGHGASGVLAPGLLENKIRDVARIAACTTQDPALLDSIRNCTRLLLEQDWAGVPETPCHGDLTLENILLTAGRSIAFIDCDETFASSWWLDFGKLFQDIDGQWCLRALHVAETPRVRLLNAQQKLEQLGAQLRPLAAALDPRLPGRLPQLAALGLFRALPYAKSESLAAFLCHRIHHVLEAPDATPR